MRPGFSRRKDESRSYQRRGDFFEAVESFVEFADHPFIAIVIALLHFYKEEFVNCFIKEGGVHVHLVDIQLVEGRNCKFSDNT